MSWLVKLLGFQLATTRESYTLHFFHENFTSWNSGCIYWGNHLLQLFKHSELVDRWRASTLCHMAIFEKPTASIYTGCLCKKAAEERSLPVPQTLLVGLNEQGQGSNVSNHASLFHKSMLTTVLAITCELTQGIRTTWRFILFYSKEVLHLQFLTINLGTSHIYEREKNCTISSTFAHYLENSALRPRTEGQDKSFHQVFHSQVRKDTAS